MDLALDIFLEVWNGEDYQNEIFKLLSYRSLRNFDGKWKLQGFGVTTTYYALISGVDLYHI